MYGTENFTRIFTEKGDFYGHGRSQCDTEKTSRKSTEVIDYEPVKHGTAQVGTEGQETGNGGRYWNRTSDLMRVMHAL